MSAKIEYHHYAIGTNGKYYVPIGDILDLIQKTEPMPRETQPNYYRRLLGTNECHTDPRALNKYIKKIWTDVSSTKQNHSNVLIPSPGKKISKFREPSRMSKKLVTSRILDNPPNLGETLEEYYDRITNGRKLTKKNIGWVKSIIESKYNLEIVERIIQIRSEPPTEPVNDGLLDIVNDILTEYEVDMLPIM